MGVCIVININVLAVYLHATHYFRNWQIKLKTLQFHIFFFFWMRNPDVIWLASAASHSQQLVSVLDKTAIH